MDKTQVNSFCHDYVYFLFHAGRAAVIATIVLGILLAAAAVVLAVRKPPVVANANLATAIANPTPVIDSIRAFIQAIASAPTWLALFGGGLLLLWMAGYAAPDYCKAPPPPPQAPAAHA
ncbi:MAG: hypothetical protein JWO81_523 [Alphaproteobacteria bacterium]|nr:hypothetical protein [Alphaproteobacteria bacterium]